MQLSPVYGPESLIELDGDPAAIGAITIRQRRRFVATLGELDDAAWAAPTRCEGWTAREVASHLESATSFWDHSIRTALAEGPTTFLANFDPVAVPAALAGADQRSNAEILEALHLTTESLAELLTALSPGDWTRLAEGPPGHITVSAVAHHGHWDDWTHERDVLVPLGAAPPVEPDEVLAALRYVATLGPAFAVSRGEQRPAHLEVRTTDPEQTFTVTAGDRVRVDAGPSPSTPDLVLAGDALDLLEQLSIRRPFTLDVASDQRWLVEGLAVTFDRETI